MAEKAIFYARAVVVFHYDAASKSWTPTPVGNDYSTVTMYENSATGTYRVIGRGVRDQQKISINSNVTKDTNYGRATDTFHQWSDSRYTYGLNFGNADEARSFGDGFLAVVEKLRNGAGSAPSPPTAPKAPTPPTAPRAVAPAAPAAPAAPPAPKPPAAPPAPAAPKAPPAPPAPPGPPAPPPPPAPKAPPAPGAPPSQNRGALLNSISGFNANKLRKTETVDKSGPLIEKPKGGVSSGEPSAAAGRGGGGGGDSAPAPAAGTMMAEIMARQKKMQSGGPSANAIKTVDTAAPRAPVSAPAPTKATPAAPAKPAQPPPAPNANKAATLRAQGQSITQSLQNGGGSSGSTSPKPLADGGGSFNAAPLGAGGDSFSRAELQQLKDEILNEVRAELAQLKTEILAAIQTLHG